MKVSKTFPFIFFLTLASFGLAQTQLGSDISAVAERDWLGSAVAISADGSRIAVGARGNNNSNGQEAGQVRILEWADDDWVQLGSAINGEAQFDRSGAAVDLSADGNRVAIGAKFNNGGNIFSSGHVRVYEWTDGDWTQIGLDINGSAERDFLGAAVALSADGNRLIAGAPHNESDPAGPAFGYVRVYEWIADTWVQIGEDLVGESLGDEAGATVVISADGNRIAFGAPFYGESVGLAGQVKVFEWTGDAWIQMGEDFEGIEDNDREGYALAMSADGNRIAIGSYSGQTKVFEWINDVWVQQGTTIFGIGSDGPANALSMSDNGNRVAIGIPTNDETGFNSGKVRVYDWSNGDWSSASMDITGENEEGFGESVALSSDGQQVVVGASSNNEVGTFAGQVRVYALGAISAVQAPQRLDWSIFPNPTTGQVYFSDIKPETIRILDGLGRVVFHQNVFNGHINISNLPKGWYILQVGTEGAWENQPLIKR